MKTFLKSLALVGLLGSQASAQSLAIWAPSPAGSPEGDQYISAGSRPLADFAVPELRMAIAERVNAGTASNEGAVWPGSSNSGVFDPASYTSFSLVVADDAEIQIGAFTYFLNTYGTERTLMNAGTPEEAEVLSTIQLRLRSSIDNFANDIGSITSLPADRLDTGDLQFTFDLINANGLDAIRGDIEFRLYIWEESEVPSNDPFMWIDLSPSGAFFEGQVNEATEMEPVVRDVLVRIFPEPRPESDPPEETDPAPNSALTPPTLVELGEGIAGVDAMRVEQGGASNRSSVWPGNVTSFGFSEFSYLETTVQPTAGTTLSITQYTIPSFITYGTNDGGAWEAVIRSSVDDFTNDLAMTSGEGNFTVDFDLADVAELQNLNNAVTLRVYLWETAAVDGTDFDPFMWFDLAGNNDGTLAAIQVLGSTQQASLAPPAVSSIGFVPGEGLVVDAINLTPGRTYGLFFSSDLAEPFVSIGVEEVATESTLSLIDDFADLDTDPRAFYRVEEVTPQ